LFCGGYRRHRPLALINVLVAGTDLEAAQLMTTDRHAEIGDALVKTAGGIAGVGLGLVGRRASLNRIEVTDALLRS